MNNTVPGKSGFSVLWCTNQVHLDLDEGNRWCQEPAPTADGKDGAAARVHPSTQDDDAHRLRDRPHGCLWRDCTQNAAKRLH